MATAETMQILKMVESGKITAEDGAKLLSAIGNGEGNGRGTEQHLDTTQQLANAGDVPRARWLRIRVTNMTTGKAKVNLNLPIGLVNVGAKLAGRYAPETKGVEWDKVIEAIRAGGQGKIVDVEDHEDNERVEILVE